MALPKIIGLDIGSNAVKMVEIDRSKKGFELEYVGLAPLPDGAIVDKSIKKADLVGNAIRALHNLSSRNKYRVYLACRQSGDYQAGNHDVHDGQSTGKTDSDGSGAVYTI